MKHLHGFINKQHKLRVFNTKNDKCIILTVVLTQMDDVIMIIW